VVEGSLEPVFKCLRYGLVLFPSFVSRGNLEYSTRCPSSDARATTGHDLSSHPSLYCPYVSVMVRYSTRLLWSAVIGFTGVPSQRFDLIRFWSDGSVLLYYESEKILAVMLVIISTNRSVLLYLFRLHILCYFWKLGTQLWLSDLSSTIGGCVCKVKPLTKGSVRAFKRVETGCIKDMVLS